MNYLAIHRHERSMTPLLMALPQSSSMGVGRRLNIAGLPVAYTLAIGDRITRIVVGQDKDMPDRFHADDTHDFKACTVRLNNGHFIIDSDVLNWIEAWHQILLLHGNTAEEACEGCAKCGCNGFALYHARNPWALDHGLIGSTDTQPAGSDHPIDQRPSPDKKEGKL